MKIKSLFWILCFLLLAPFILGFSQKSGIVTGDEVNLRTEPVLSAPVADKLERGTVVSVLEYENSWYKVEHNEHTGWVHKTYLSTEPFLVNSRSRFVSKILEIISYAKYYLGTRYVYGGALPSGFDCSGFTMFVYSKFGYQLPHGAASQMQTGTEVNNKEDLIPGDLVFFKIPGSTKINHVGIYIGEGDFISASSVYGFVKLTRLDSGYYTSCYSGGRRLLEDDEAETL